MHPDWMRLRKWCVALSSGGVTLGLLQGFQMVNFASLFSQLLAQWLSALVTILLGGQLPTWITMV